MMGAAPPRSLPLQPASLVCQDLHFARVRAELSPDSFLQDYSDASAVLASDLVAARFRMSIESSTGPVSCRCLSAPILTS